MSCDLWWVEAPPCWSSRGSYARFRRGVASMSFCSVADDGTVESDLLQHNPKVLSGLKMATLSQFEPDESCHCRLGSYLVKSRWQRTLYALL